jgi:hypothetical protein
VTVEVRCEKCAAEFVVRRPGQRFCARRCRLAFHNAERTGRRRAKARPGVGTKNWLTDPSLPVCPVEGCLWDAPTCPEPKHRGRKRSSEGQPPANQTGDDAARD